MSYSVKPLLRGQPSLVVFGLTNPNAGQTSKIDVRSGQDMMKDPQAAFVRGILFATKDTLILGRARDCDIVIDDPTDTVSRHHCTLIWEGDKLYIVDGVKGQPSTNGTQVRGFDLPPDTRTLLSARDEITIGSVHVTVPVLERKLSFPPAPKDPLVSLKLPSLRGRNHPREYEP